MSAPTPDHFSNKTPLLIELTALGLILALAAWLRFPNLAENPGWYSDEGTLVAIAQRLAQGSWQYLALNQSMLIVARPPLFLLLLAGLFRILEPGIAVLRILTASLGVLSVLLAYLLVRRASRSPGLALLSAGLLAIYPQAVLYSRIGFSYNLLAPLALLACLCAWNFLESQKTPWLVLAGLAIGLGMVSDLMMATFLLPLLLAVSTRGWRKAFIVAAAAALPGVLYVFWMGLTVPQAFWFDLRFTLSRLGAFPLPLQVPVVLLNYYYLLARDAWFLAGLAGMFLAFPTRWRWLLMAMFVLPMVSLGRTTGFATGLEDYYLIALFPLVAIGAAYLLWVGFPHVLTTLQGGLSALFTSWGWKGWLGTRLVALAGSLALFLLLVSPWIISTALTFRDATRGFSARIDPVLINAQDAWLTIDFVNGQVGETDLVLASPALAWAVDAEAADFQQSLAADGIATRHFPADIPPDRFAFNPSLNRAEYVVVDRIWRNWGAANMPEVAAMLAEVERWPAAFTSGEFTVYQNPEMK
jgi:4-amino-4-deoxy-L-arabinose transferase-like glycosyltransferase